VRGGPKRWKCNSASDMGTMADIVAGLLQALLEGFMTVTGRWVLSLFGLKSNVFAETFLGLLIWMLVICLSIALFAALV
jgi:hypothetical protein